MRRAVPSFTVEVRRRSRLATTSSPNMQSSETKPPQVAFDRESHRAAAAAFEAKMVDQPAVDVAASNPKGRILQSLVPDEPLRRPLRDASFPAAESDPTTRAPKRPPVRPPKARDQTSKPPRNSESPSDSTPLADRLSAMSRRPSSVRPEGGTGVPPSDLTAAPTQVLGNSDGLALRAKGKRRDKMPISVDDGRGTALDDQRSAIGTNSLATPPSSVDESSRQSRKRTIMGRYVFGDELKPGERWKRRLLMTG